MTDNPFREGALDCIRALWQRQLEDQLRNYLASDADTKCQDAVEGRARFARPNIPRPSKAIGEYSE